MRRNSLSIEARQLLVCFCNIQCITRSITVIICMSFSINYNCFIFLTYVRRNVADIGGNGLTGRMKNVKVTRR